MLNMVNTLGDNQMVVYLTGSPWDVAVKGYVIYQMTRYLRLLLVGLAMQTICG